MQTLVIILKPSAQGPEINIRFSIGREQNIVVDLKQLGSPIGRPKLLNRLFQLSKSTALFGSNVSFN
jgi:hypothetical protein